MYDKYKDNLLQIAASNKDHDSNRTRLVLNPATGSPVSGTLLGVWRCYWYDNAHVFVKLEELHPIAGRVWTNFYNTGKWEGWKSVTPQ